MCGYGDGFGVGMYTPIPVPVPGLINQVFPEPVPLPGQSGYFPSKSGRGWVKPTGTGMFVIPTPICEHVIL